MRHHVDDASALLLRVEEPLRALELRTGDHLGEIVDADLGDRWVVRRARLERAKQLDLLRQRALQHGGDLEALGHDVVQQHALFLRLGEVGLELWEIGGADDHGFVGEHVETGFDRLRDVFGLARVVAGDDHHAGRRDHVHELLTAPDHERLRLEGALQVVGPGHHYFVPVRRIVGTRIEACDALQVLVHVFARRREHTHVGRHVRQHELLHQRGMKVAWVQRDEIHVASFLDDISGRKARHACQMRPPTMATAPLRSFITLSPG